MDQASGANREAGAGRRGGQLGPLGGGRAADGSSLTPLGLTLGASLLGAIVIVGLMLLPLERLTRPESARAE